ncbi:MAG: tol-pal system protein YbgF [Nitrospirae bacterium]|nr:tol-pal system protein YbgF [Nitrospirota bacterium]
MKKIYVVLMSMIVALSIAGCAMQSDYIDMENEVRRMKGILLETQRDVSILQQAQQSERGDQIMGEVRERITKVESQTVGSIDTLQKNQADFEVRLNQLSTDVQVIQGGVEENNHKLAELSEGMNDQEVLLQELSRKIDMIDARTAEVQRQPEKILLPGKDVESDKHGRPVKPETTTRVPVPPPPTTPPPSPQPVQIPSEPTREGTDTATSGLYNQAYKDYTAGRYDLAIAGFSDYLRQSPTGNLAPNALYWIGECYYSKGDYPKAIAAFESVTIDYPKSDKVVSALLKMGYGYEKLGNKEMSALYLKKVVEQFPYSQEAMLAKVKLSELK